MNLTNIFFGLMSLTNLTLFLNRVMHDGQYQTAILLYDYEAIVNTNVIQELTDYPNRTYAFVVVRMDECGHSVDMLKSYSYEKISNALHINMDHRCIDGNSVLFTRDALFLFPMQNNKQKREFLWDFRTKFHFVAGTSSVVFYQTARTIPQAFSNKTIEVYVVRSYAVAADHMVFGIDNRSDINLQMNQTRNLRDKIFDPKRKTLIYFFEHDELREVKSILKSKDVMSSNANVFMANYITRNIKNLSTWQFMNKKIGEWKLIKYEPPNEKIYAELFMSSMEIHVPEKYKDL